MRNPLRIACIVGARPNFMKVAPLLRAFEAHPHVQPILVHTGQHYDPTLSDVFFADLDMRKPDVHLAVGSGTQAVQTARVLEKMERLLQDGHPVGERIDRVLVVGDVNSTLAATLAAVKLGIPVAHVEAGLRSFDRSMPEEINRVVTDTLADLLFVSEPVGVRNLRREGHSEASIHLVGNVMIDSLVRLLPLARQRSSDLRLRLASDVYGIVTLHRPSNVDRAATLSKLVEVLVELSRDLPLVFPVHPRTAARLGEFGLEQTLAAARNIHRTPPLGYLEFLGLMESAAVVVTDSGGLQEETTALEIPCLTMRENTERPITVDEGSNTLIGNDLDKLMSCCQQVLRNEYGRGRRPQLWDGQASTRIAEILATTPRQ